jgi:carboxypeptidase C (cathepsin A)
MTALAHLAATAMLALSWLSLATLASAQVGVSKEFVSTLQNDTKLRYVKNSGICETTPGVEQISGYIDVGKNMSMWFWFFEARQSPETAPFTLWFAFVLAI